MEIMGDAGDGLVSPMNCSLSPRAGNASGGGEDMVQDFVRLHMMSILQPFAGHVQDLKAQIEEILGDLSALHETTDGHDQRLNQHEQQLSTLSEGASQTSERLEKVQSEQMSLKREKARLDGNHEMTKAAVGKTKDTLSTLSSSVEELERALRENAQRVGGLEQGLVETEQRIGEQLETRLNKQGAVCKSLNERQGEMQKTCQQAKALAESASAACKTLAGSVEQQNAQDLGSFAALRDRTSELEARLQDVDQALQLQGGGLAAADKELQHLKTWTEQVRDLEHIHAQQLDMSSSLKDQACRLDRAEVSILHVQSDLALEKEQQNAEFCSLEERITKNISDIVKWKDTLKGQCDILCTASERLDELESGQSGLLVRTDTADRELQSLASWRQKAAQSVDAHASLLERARADLLVAKERIDGNSTHIQSLRSDVGSDQEMLAKLSTRVETVSRCFNGLGKGLQDTHRQIVNGENGLLPPKAGGSLLPAIPMPRTPRAGAGTDRTPRKRSCPPAQAAA
mmetsp:Transcript_35736/g.100494  ORF Transcript_35736/g.100494 Transcript_35736/m.100494 type:complete len:516 (-) Transcript_35736:53-1600(-)